MHKARYIFFTVMESEKKTGKEDRKRQAEHRKKVLAAVQGGGGGGCKYLSGSGDDFKVSLRFANRLPSVPSGPFFKKIGLSHNAEDFAHYSASTLEKNYIWGRHLPVDMNVTLKLEDQDSVCEPSKPEYHVANEAETYLEGSVDRTKQTKKQAHASAASHWWLRETTFGDAHYFRERNNNAPNQSELEARLGITQDDEHMLSDEAVIENSFASIAQFDATDDQVEWSLPVLPSERYGQAFSLTRFTENPAEVVTWGAKSETGRKGEAVGKKRAAHSIITNIRPTKKSISMQYAGTLVIPSSSDDSACSKYQWAQDYTMVLNTSLTSHYVLVVGDSSIVYDSIGVHIDMLRLAPPHDVDDDDIIPHDCEVLRTAAE